MASGKRRGGKKRSQKKRRDESQQEAAPLIPFGDPRAMEKVSQDLGRLLAEKGFGSIEEANAFLENMLRACANRRVAYVPRGSREALHTLLELTCAKSSSPNGAAS
jgi:hypothetical protein